MVLSGCFGRFPFGFCGVCVFEEAAAFFFFSSYHFFARLGYEEGDGGDVFCFLFSVSGRGKS